MFQLQPLSGGGLKDEYTLYAKAWFTFDGESCIFYVSLRSEREGRVLRWGHKKPDLLLEELDTGHTPVLSLLGLTAILLCLFTGALSRIMIYTVGTEEVTVLGLVIPELL